MHIERGKRQKKKLHTKRVSQSKMQSQLTTNDIRGQSIFWENNWYSSNCILTQYLQKLESIYKNRWIKMQNIIHLDLGNY